MHKVPLVRSSVVNHWSFSDCLLPYYIHLQRLEDRRAHSAEGQVFCHIPEVGTWSEPYSHQPLPLTSTSHHAHLGSRSPAYHCGYLNWVIGVVVATRAFQSAHLPIQPFTTILYVLQKEQPDVTSYIPCILSLACNWSIDYSWLASTLQPRNRDPSVNKAQLCVNTRNAL